jgi:hypothetical protein
MIPLGEEAADIPICDKTNSPPRILVVDDERDAASSPLTC